ncbi:hypothetical protein TNCV_3849371 [Trichonephila clavipes]|uniref:Uncharacterized protein n=1 Tax=Trichonephila clavipes TaxID=2585209 RepID=A0A8X6V045_TRICX|nr:hypothetical protein TNCV_3849371 [Trichonephila clavipes]
MHPKHWRHEYRCENQDPLGKGSEKFISGLDAFHLLTTPPPSPALTGNEQEGKPSIISDPNGFLNLRQKCLRFEARPMDSCRRVEGSLSNTRVSDHTLNPIFVRNRAWRGPDRIELDWRSENSECAFSPLYQRIAFRTRNSSNS